MRAEATFDGWRGAFLQLVAAVALAALLLAAIEIASGFYLRARAPRLEDRIGVGADNVDSALATLDLAPETNPTPLVLDAALLWRNKPSATKTAPMSLRLDGRDDTWTMRIDARGYRGPDPAPRDGDVYRVLCIGDSITFGFNVDQEDVFAPRLEALLAAGHPGRRIEVVNAGVPGWSWAQGVRFLELEGLRLRPDVVVMGHGTNDQFFIASVTDPERLRLTRTAPGRAVAAAGLFLSRTRTARALRALLGPARERPPSPGCRAQMVDPRGCRRVAVPDIERLVHEARRASAGAGADLVVINVDFMRTPAAQGSRAAAEQDRVPYLDFVDRFATLAAAETRQRTERLGLRPADPQPAEFAPESPTPRRVTFRVTGLPPGAVASVRGASYPRDVFRFAETVRDDATWGDEVAGDGVFSASVEVPGNIPLLAYQFLRDGVPEMTPLPPAPARAGDRTVRLTAAPETMAHVDVFGTLFLMAEMTHPNADGQAVIAADLAAAIAGLPSYRAAFAGVRR